MPKDTFFNLPDEKRNRILDSAILQLYKTHYKKVTIDSIVNNARIPKGSFYQYFENKDDLYIYIFCQMGDKKKNILKEFQKYVNEMDFKEYLINLLEEANKFESSDSKLIEIKNKFINECPQEVRRIVLKNEIPKSYSLIKECISSYIKNGEIRKDLDVGIAAYIFTTCIVGIENYEFKEGESINTVIAKIIDILIKGFM
ncbi:TetR/AcrR family transcriptional regulator [Anaerovorax odorimutans]|uniref:TetR/AcrR family transcriptional regulator n=1 Tax=Anaerovorax odorimutans TaxID=109327 RepID=UPI0003FD1FC3|nr:TetR/AcrR family transcriptional regulator [Anaerovorax odorimutans]